MPVFPLASNEPFPPVQFAEPDGLLAYGGTLAPGRLVEAYSTGIFPWYGEGEPILWWSPDPRFVLYPEELHVQKSLRPVLNQSPFQLTLNQAFPQVIAQCRQIPRPGQSGTWITTEMMDAYVTLNRLGWAHSLEVWQEEKLVGGLYGVAMGKVFCGESMFTQVADASKYGFVRFVQWLQSQSFKLVDCQVYTDHLARFGAREIPRKQFLEQLKQGIGDKPQPAGWKPQRLD